MKKTGFSLAEILIALAVIGVVSALTIPQLSLGVNKQAMASALSSSMTGVENALTTIIMRNEVKSLKETDFYTASKTSAADTLKALSPYYGIVKSGDKPTDNNMYSSLSIRKLGGGTDTLPESITLITKHGSALIITPIKEPKTTELSVDVQQLYDLIIDVNGNKQPNMIGRDIFKYAVGDDGKLYPYGGKAYAEYIGSDSNVWSGTGTLKCNGTGDGWGCAGKLAVNGYKMDY